MNNGSGGTPLNASRPTDPVSYRGLSIGGLTFGTEGTAL